MIKQPRYRWHLELSSRCALACPRCPRTGKENKKKFAIADLSLELIKSVFSPEVLSSSYRILLCGGNGDPIYNPQMLEIVAYLKAHNPQVALSIVTNGSHKKVEWWQQLAKTLNEYDRLIFSVDGWDQESNQKYRVNSKFSDILEATKACSESKALLAWSTIVFSFNQDHLSKIQTLAKNLGVNEWIASLSTKFGADWAQESKTDPLQPRAEFLGDSDNYQKYYTPLNPKVIKKNAMGSRFERDLGEAQKVFAGSDILPKCQFGDRGLYINSSGLLFPCGWISHPYDMELKEGQQNPWLSKPEAFDLKQRSLDQILQSPDWQSILRSWSDPKRSFVVCDSKCKKGSSLTERMRSRIWPQETSTDVPPDLP